MELKQYIENFKILNKFKNQLPGILSGLNFIKNFDISNISKSDTDLVSFFDCNSSNIIYYSFNDLNVKIKSSYTNSIINDKVIVNNRLYWIFSSILERNIKKNNYKYKGNFTIHQILSKFIHGLRISRTSDITKYFVYDILNIYHVQYLEIDANKFYLLMFDFILDLWQEKVLSYGREDHSIAFNPLYKEDLFDLVFFSFELMLLGKNDNLNLNSFDLELKDNNLERNLTTLHNNYFYGNEEDKYRANDITFLIVLCCAVDKISAEAGINNVLIDNLMYGIANKNK